MLYKLVSSIIVSTLLFGCGKTDEPQTADTARIDISIEHTLPLNRAKPFNSIQACKLATEIKQQDMDIADKTGSMIIGDNTYTYDINEARGKLAVRCFYNKKEVVKLYVGGSLASPSIIRPTYINPNKYFLITDLAHIANSKVSDKGGLLSFYAIMETQLPSKSSCLHTKYSAQDDTHDSIFISVNGEPFQNIALAESGDNIMINIYALPQSKASTVIRVKNRETPIIYGFEIKSCE